MKKMKKKVSIIIVLAMVMSIVTSISISPVHAASTYDVGTGYPYTTLSSVPWKTLQPGDVVNIHYRAGNPYREKFVLSQSGTTSQHIRIVGIPGPGGELPVIDGSNATAKAADFYSSLLIPLGAIFVAPAPGYTYGYKPKYIDIEGLEICDAHPNYTYTVDGGAATHYDTFSSAIYIDRAENINVKNCKLHNSGMGVFSNAKGDEATQTRNILIEGCYFYNNGVINDYHEHNTYIQSVGATYQYNRYEALTIGAPGSTLKDRSAGTVIRFNWFISSARILDLVEAEDSFPIVGADPSYKQTFVYGNILYNGPGANFSTGMIHYGGDKYDYSHYRRGTLYYYNNTLVSICDLSGTNGRWRTMLFDMPASDETGGGPAEETVDCRNNIIYNAPYTTGAQATQLQLLETSGILNLQVNWISLGYQQHHDGLPFTGTINGESNLIVGDASNNPGFVNVAAMDYHLTSGSPCIDRGVALASACSSYPVNREYVTHQSSKARTASGSAMDLGAYEYIGGGSTPTPTPTPTPTSGTPTPTPTPTATPTPTPTPGGFPIIIFQDTQNFTFSGGTGTGVIDNTSGVGGSKCVKFVQPTGYAETVHMDYSANPINLTGVVSTDKLQLSVDVGTANVSVIYVYLNSWQYYLTITGLDHTAGYQTYNLSLSGVLSGLGGNITAVYFKPDVAGTIYADNISIVH